MSKRRRQDEKLGLNSSIAKDIHKKGYFTLTNVALLQTADQVLDIIKIKFSKDLNFTIDAKKNAYILKFRNCNSYLFGTE